MEIAVSVPEDLRKISGCTKADRLVDDYFLLPKSTGHWRLLPECLFSDPDVRMVMREFRTENCATVFANTLGERLELCRGSSIPTFFLTGSDVLAITAFAIGKVCMVKHFLVREGRWIRIASEKIRELQRAEMTRRTAFVFDDAVTRACEKLYCPTCASRPFDCLHFARHR